MKHHGLPSISRPARGDAGEFSCVARNRYMLMMMMMMMIMMVMMIMMHTSDSGHKLPRVSQRGEEDAVLTDVGHQGGGGARVEPWTQQIYQTSLTNMIHTRLEGLDLSKEKWVDMLTPVFKKSIIAVFMVLLGSAPTTQ